MTFQQLYDTYNKMVYNLALQYVQNTEDAQEITQDVFVVIHQSINDYKQQSQISTWIYRIAINKSLDLIKAKKRRKRFVFLTSLFHPDNNEVRYDRSSFDHPGILLEQKEELGKIFKFINDLPANQKTALILSKIESKSQKEIAEIMDLSSKAVESLVQRAKTNLSKKLNISEG